MILSKHLKVAAITTTMLLAVLAAGLAGLGCGGDQPVAPPPQTPVAQTETPKAVEPPQAVEPPKAVEPPAAAPAAALPAVPEGAPVTYEVLQLTPAQAQFAIALPPANGVLAKALPLARRIAPPEIDIDKEWQQIISDMAKDAGAGDAKDLNEIALAKGVDLNAPIAVFADFTSSVDSAAKAAEAAKPAAEAAPAGDAQAAPAAPAEPVSAPKIELEDLEPPAWAAVLGVADQAKAEATLKEIIETVPELSGKQAEDVAVGGVVVKSLAPYAYFFAGNKLALGSLDLVKGVAERVAAPAKIRYGTPECPATANDEAVALLFGGRALPLISKAVPLLKMDDSAQAFLNGQMAALEAMMGGEGGEDPMIASLAWTDDSIELKSRMDTAAHSAVLELSGKASPLKLAQLLPESTLGMVSLRLTPEYKKQISEVWINALPEEMKQEPSFAQGVTIGKQALSLLGEEVTLGVTGLEADFPGAILMVQLANAESTKGLLQMLVPTTPGETYNEVEINTIAAPIPIPLSIAFQGDMVMVSNSIDDMKKIIDLIKENKTTGLFAKLQPPLDPATPRYNAVVLNTSLVTDVVVPIAMLMGGGLGEAQPIVDQVSALVREVRLLSEMNGTWAESKVAVYLKPAAAPAPVEAAPASAEAAPAAAPAEAAPAPAAQ